MAINICLSTIESKTQTKQIRRTVTVSWIRIVSWWLPDGIGVWGMGEEVRGLRSTNWSLQNSHGDVQYSIRNGVANEIILVTRGHEQ